MKPLVFESEAAYQAATSLVEPLHREKARLLELAMYRDRLAIFWWVAVPFLMVALALLIGLVSWLEFAWSALIPPTVALGACMLMAYPASPSSPKRIPVPSPTPELIRKTREDCGLSTGQAAEVVYRTARNWQQWEAGERAMDPALWELFRLKMAMNSVRSP